MPLFYYTEFAISYGIRGTKQDKIESKQCRIESHL